MHRALLTALCVLLASTALAERPSDSSIWAQNLRSMPKAGLDTVAQAVGDLTIEHHSFTFTIDTGRFIWLEPTTSETGPMRWAAYFEGKARFRFVPPVSIERDQVRRFYDTDSLDQFVTSALILFDDSLRSVIEHTGGRTGAETSLATRRSFEQLLRPLVRHENSLFTFSVMRALVHPGPDPFLLVMTELEDRSHTAYMYDPYRREPVHLVRDHNIPGEQFMELVSSYVDDIDESYATVNGHATDQLSPRHVEIEAALSDGGEFRGSATITYDVLDESTQFVRMALHEELEVDSIRDRFGSAVPFVRYENDSHKSEGLYLLFDRPYNPDDSLRLSYYYHGDIAKREAGEFKVDAGASWYPRYGFGRRSTYSIRFRTPRDLTFIVSADLIDSTTTGDTLYTHWEAEIPVTNLSFNIGWFTRYEFGGDGTPPVSVYYNEPLHRNVLKGSGRSTYNDVGDDIVACLELFSNTFGPFPFDRLVVGEIFYSHGESFPGFIHMGANTFISTDNWGEDHLFRAHEVAHQWWGSSLGYETYHDQWLSEGFATYASLLYLQQAKGDDRYYDKLKEYADDIFSARKYLFFDGAESGPVILGRRTASTKTEGDYNLIIYKKGAFVLHMLRTLLTDWETRNDSRFFEMLKEFHQTYRGATASTSDFRHTVERFTGTDMGWFFDQWVYHNELPEYRFVYDIESEATRRQARCTVTLESGPDNFRTLMPFEIRYDDRRTVYRTAWLEGNRAEFVLPLDGEVDKIVMNPFTAVLARVKQ
ncbi:hypothetical protein KQH82_04850 [bacterium]|nr:hypothetical protein [bacterium]